jgi:predicted TIM-barrel fold metal-dependent hydrolase
MHLHLACDSHLHIFDSSEGGVPQHQTVQSLLGTDRAVVVQPRAYGIDNRITLEAIATLGIERTRGIAVVHPDISDATLKAMHAGGIRGVRMSLYTAAHAAVSFDMLEPLANKIKNLGWHLQLHWTADQIAEHANRLLALPVPIVFDHMARLPTTNTIKHPAFAVVKELLTRGDAWVKLSGAYLCTEQSQSQGTPYADVKHLAQMLLDLAPTRLVWGSDWPHVTEVHHKPNTRILFDLLADWTNHDESLCQQVLVTNPAQLYGF